MEGDPPIGVYRKKLHKQSVARPLLGTFSPAKMASV